MSKHTSGIANQSSFARVNSPAPQRSVIPVSTRRIHSGDAGYLIPAFHTFVLPGDVFNLKLAIFSRLLTLRFPIMDNLILDWFAFFIPERILWDNFERMQGFQPDPSSSTDFVFPWINGDPLMINEHTLGDYMGLPVDEAIDDSVYHIRSGPFRAYRAVWNEWFRDQNYQDSVPLSGDPLDPRGDGPDSYDIVGSIFRRNKRPDYFSSALPNPQKGPDVPIPWAEDGRAPVYGVDGDTSIQFYNVTDNVSLELRATTGGNVAPSVNGTGTDDWLGLAPFGSVPSGIYADVQAVSASLNALRESVVLQQIYELDARGGTRYSESLLNRWNVDAGDARLQRPEFIVAGSSNYSVSQVPQTSPTVGDDAQASLAAYSELSAIGHIAYTAVEHGHLMLLMSVRAPLTYQQNLNRKWLAASRFDLPEPLTMNLGERAVMQYEIYFPPILPTTVWGYQEIWAEYRYEPSFVTGRFRSNSSQSLDPWHLALDYGATPPEHTDVWVQDDPPVARVVQQINEPQLKFDVLLKGTKASCMPVVSIPGLLRF